MEIIGLAAVFLILAGLGFLLMRKGSRNGGSPEEFLKFRQEHEQLKIALAVSEERGRLLQEEKERVLADLLAERQQSAQTLQALESSRSYYKAQQEKIAEQKAELEQTRERFNKDFELIAGKILEEKTTKFTESNRNSMDLLLSPLKENIKAFEDKVEKVYKAESDERNVLKGEISKLMELNKQISEEAHNLTRALKSDSKKQGNWGEVVLDRILEGSGLIEGESYSKQGSFITEDGNRMQPDVIVTLPDNKHIIIDSKVSLIAYERMVNCETEDERSLHLKSHLVSVRSHISNLGGKNYHDLYGVNSPDFVLLFIPIESCFAIAIQNDLDLFEFAWNKRVVLVTPSTLLATLRTISSIWKQEQQTRNAIEIATKAGALYDKFVGFISDLKRVGDSLDRAKETYNEAFGKLSSGSGNLVGRIETLKKLGARATKEIDRRFIEDEA